MTRAILIAGPTASGKSALALDLARRFQGTVVNADSRQVYAELRVLTARPGREEAAEIPHLLFGHVSALEAYSAGRWLEDAAKVLAETRREGRLAVFAGGTGLYFKALTQGLAPVPDIPEAVSRYWRGEAAKRGSEGLHAILSERDPSMAAKLRPSDPQRIVRALEVIDATGLSLADWQAAPAPPLLDPSEAVRLVLAPPRLELRARIAQRFEEMLAKGAIDEVRALLALNLDPGLPAMRAHGVRPLAAHLSGAIPIEEAAARTVAETAQYAKRQITWARRYMADWQWFPDAGEAAETVAASLARTLSLPGLTGQSSKH